MQSWMIKAGGVASLMWLLTACSVVQTNTSEMAAADVAIAEVEKTADLPLTKELMYYVLGAEIAGQRGELAIAVEMYYQASLLAQSQQLAARSAEIAGFSRNIPWVERAMSRWIEIEPDNAKAYEVLASVQLVQGQLDNALESAEKGWGFTTDSEDNSLYFDELASALASNPDVVPEDALSWIKRLTAYQAGNADAQYAYARLAGHFKQHEEALGTLNKLSGNKDRDKVALLKSAVLQDQGRDKEALAVLSKAYRQGESEFKLQQAYALALSTDGELDKAKVVFEALLEQTPGNEQVLFSLGLLALEETEYEQAKSRFSAVLKLGDSTEQAAYFMGQTAKEMGEPDKALVWLASVPPTSRYFYSAQGEYVALLAEKGQLQKARDHFKLLRKERPEDMVVFYREEARFLRIQKQDDDAMVLLNQAMHGFPQNTDLLYDRAMLAESMDKLDIAEADLREILVLKPNDSEALNSLGYTLADRTTRYEEAEQLITQALAQSPNNAFILDSMGWLYYRQGKLVAAQEYLEQALAARYDAEILIHLGEVLWQQGAQAAADQRWQQAAEVDADNELLRETLQRLKP